MVMKFLDVLFYRYFLYYSKRISIYEDPYIVTSITLSASEAIFGVMTLNIIGAFFCLDLMMKYLFPTWLVLFAVNYYIYVYRKRGEKITMLKPKILGNEKLSHWLSFFFFLFSLSMLFWTKAVVKELLSQCK